MPEIQRADPRQRRVAMVIALLAIALVTGIYFVLAGYIDQLRALPPAQAKPALVSILGWSTAVVCVMVCALGWHGWRQGRQIRSAGRFPLPHTKVIRDTIVLSGRDAHTRGRIVQGIGAALILSSGALAIAVWRLLSFVTSTPTT
ncbi:MAG: hypothetical protein FJY56_02960 [Betaproteobacteria bacterium]|nr:hypothetical protein [Betaproteobacteria bacterium]